VVRRGDEGRVKTKLGLWVPFVITEVEEGRAWRWSVAGVDATGHLVEAHPHGCRVTFTAPRWALPYELVLRPSLAALSRRLG